MNKKKVLLVFISIFLFAFIQVGVFNVQGYTPTHYDNFNYDGFESNEWLYESGNQDFAKWEIDNGLLGLEIDTEREYLYQNDMSNVSWDDTEININQTLIDNGNMFNTTSTTNGYVRQDSLSIDFYNEVLIYEINVTYLEVGSRVAIAFRNATTYISDMIPQITVIGFYNGTIDTSNYNADIIGSIYVYVLGSSDVYKEARIDYFNIFEYESQATAEDVSRKVKCEDDFTFITEYVITDFNTSLMGIYIMNEHGSLLDDYFRLYFQSYVYLDPYLSLRLYDYDLGEATNYNFYNVTDYDIKYTLEFTISISNEIKIKISSLESGIIVDFTYIDYTHKYLLPRDVGLLRFNNYQNYQKGLKKSVFMYFEYMESNFLQPPLFADSILNKHGDICDPSTFDKVSVSSGQAVTNNYYDGISKYYNDLQHFSMIHKNTEQWNDNYVNFTFTGLWYNGTTKQILSFQLGRETFGSTYYNIKSWIIGNGVEGSYNAVDVTTYEIDYGITFNREDDDRYSISYYYSEVDKYDWNLVVTDFIDIPNIEELKGIRVDHLLMFITSGGTTQSDTLSEITDFQEVYGSISGYRNRVFLPSDTGSEPPPPTDPLGFIFYMVINGLMFFLSAILNFIVGLIVLGVSAFMLAGNVILSVISGVMSSILSLLPIIWNQFITNASTFISTFVLGVLNYITTAFTTLSSILGLSIGFDIIVDMIFIVQQTIVDMTTILTNFVSNLVSIFLLIIPFITTITYYWNRYAGVGLICLGIYIVYDIVMNRSFDTLERVLTIFISVFSVLLSVVAILINLAVSIVSTIIDAVTL